MQLRSLLIVTGTVHVEGGDTMQIETVERKEHTTTQIHRREVKPDRRRANVIATSAMRDLRQIRVLKTPFGTLVEPSAQQDLERILAAVDREIADFNRNAKDTQVVNGILVERLAGKRLAAVRGWLTRRIREKDAKVLEARGHLEAREETSA